MIKLTLKSKNIITGRKEINKYRNSNFIEVNNL